ncbi:MAG TPA: phage holin family protein [Candidatus Binatia bacterium]
MNSSNMNPSYHTRGDNDRGESVIELMRGIVQDARTLSAKELAAAKLEITQEIKKIVTSSILLGIGVFILAVAFILLSIVIALALAQYVPLPTWAGFAIVGGVYLVIGVIVVFAGRRKLQTAKPIPQHSLRGVKDDAQYIKEKATGH